MDAVSIRLITLGRVPHGLDLRLLRTWQSGLFRGVNDAEHYEIRSNSDRPDWSFSDRQIGSQLPERGSEDLLIALTCVPLEDNYYTRRVAENILVFSFHEISEILSFSNVPLENGVLRLLYSCSLVYKRAGRVPPSSETTNFSHDETRGCIYDMTGLKEDMAYSCAAPGICPECYERCVSERVPTTSLDACRRELVRVRKPLFFRLADAVREHPLMAIVLSSAWAFVLSLLASILANRLGKS